MARKSKPAKAAPPIDRPPIEYAWRTHTGLVRQINEDAVAVSPDKGVIVVADGIGGASAGEVASSMAATTISQRLESQSGLRDQPEKTLRIAEAAVNEANGAVLMRARSDSRYAGMGTTVVVGYIGDGWLAYAHVGDSRLYQLRENALRQLTVDHSFIQDVVNQGFFPSLEEAREYGINENVLTRAVGSSVHLNVATDMMELRAGDLYLFCTDGLSNMVSDEAICYLLAAARGKLDTVADALIHLACEAGGVDNITLALLRINRVD